MHTKIRNGRAMLYRSKYVRKGETGNSHGYSEQTFVGSLPLASLDIPARLASLLSKVEVEYVNKKPIAPAKLAADQRELEKADARRAEEARELDPEWRIVEAERLLTEARNLASSPGARVVSGRIAPLYSVLAELAAEASSRPDPMDAVVQAAKLATAAVKSGHYGNAPTGNLRDTAAYKRWLRIREGLESGPDSLLKALQAKGLARVRG
ncbi:hypothetical protein PQQ72_15635 [Paraburkholderia strydomiana]|uniref:hypothetical protein n=1 Tax=Paraburkholderia strydomiana TaxID=1245417 RepID=UPI0038BC324A